MTRAWSSLTHITKLDPDKKLRRGDSYADVCQSGTDAIVIGGTTGVTDEKVMELIDACQSYNIPLYQEPNSPHLVVKSEAITEYLVPVVLNAGDVFWLIGAHKAGIALYPGHPWDQTTTEAYIVLNPESAVAEYTEADCDLTETDVVAYAVAAERFFGQHIIYIEYSGTLGNPEIVSAVNDSLSDATLFYGGGIHDYNSAYTMAEHADVIVVGNLLYEEGIAAVRETIAGARDAQS